MGQRAAGWASRTSGGMALPTLINIALLSALQGFWMLAVPYLVTQLLAPSALVLG